MEVIEEVPTPVNSLPAGTAPPQPPGAPKIPRRPPPTAGAFNKFLRVLRKPFYNSRDLRYIDEDSDDEIVLHVGRPTSIHYQSPRPVHRVSKRRRKSSLFGSLGSRKSSNRRAPRRRYVRAQPDYYAGGSGSGSDAYSTDPGTPSSVRSDLSYGTWSTASTPQLPHVPQNWGRKA